MPDGVEHIHAYSYYLRSQDVWYLALIRSSYFGGVFGYDCRYLGRWRQAIMENK